MSCKPNCDLIVNLKSEICPAACDKKCHSDHQTLFACVDGVGRRLGQTVNKKFLLQQSDQVAKKTQSTP